jgi:hypothetical protein
MTEPPAAPALELLATETGVVVEVELIVCTPPKINRKKSGKVGVLTPTFPYDDEWLRLVRH